MNNRQKLVQKQFLNNEEAVIKQLEDIYDRALTDINEKVKDLSFTINKLQVQYDWMDPTDPEKERIKSMIQSKIYQRNYQEQLKTQVDGILKTMNVKEFTNISDYLDTCYTDGFIGTVFDAYGQGVPFYSPINQEAMVRAVQLDSKISKGLYTKLGEDVDLLKKRITAEVSRGIATGKTYAQVAKQLENQTRIGFNKAVRIARTEGHRVQTTATMDAMEQAKARGADVVKQWDSTLDGKTRESHASVDGEIRELDKSFSNGLMYPGDPSGKAAEVVNCRCALLQRARWALDDEFTKFNNFTKQVEEFESPEDYGEFKKAFFSKGNKQYMNYVEQMQDKYGTSNFGKMLSSMSEREYEHYHTLFGKNPMFNKNLPTEEIPDGLASLRNVFNESTDEEYMVESVAKILDNADDKYREVYNYYMNSTEFTKDGVGAYFDPTTKRVNIDTSYVDDLSGHTVVHEMGHRILDDNQDVWDKYKEMIQSAKDNDAESLMTVIVNNYCPEYIENWAKGRYGYYISQVRQYGNITRTIENYTLAEEVLDGATKQYLKDMAMILADDVDAYMSFARITDGIDGLFDGAMNSVSYYGGHGWEYYGGDKDNFFHEFYANNMLIDAMDNATLLAVSDALFPETRKVYKKVFEEISKKVRG